MNNAAVASVESIRSQFPALERHHNGHPVAYFDGPGGTQVPRAVGEAMLDYLYHHNANTHWSYPTSAETDALLWQAREAVADMLGSAPTEVAFGANMTTLTFHLARALGRKWGAGDEVVVTELDHHANLAPWQALVQERGITLRVVPFNPGTGRLDLAAMATAIGPRTRLVAVGMASNAIGTVTDVATICAQAAAAGALSFVDAVHAAAHLPIDVRRIECDFLSCSAYKFYGPHIGILFGRGTQLEALDLPKLIPAADDPPESLETGTQNHEGIVGAAAAVSFLASLTPGAATRRDAIRTTLVALHHRGEDLLTAMWNGLSSIPGVQCYGPPPGTPRTPTIGFTVRGKTPEQMAITLAEQGVFVSHGDFYAVTVIERLGVEGLVRAGCTCYTTLDEVERLVLGVRRASELT